MDIIPFPSIKGTAKIKDSSCSRKERVGGEGGRKVRVVGCSSRCRVEWLTFLICALRATTKHRRNRRAATPLETARKKGKREEGRVFAEVKVK